MPRKRLVIVPVQNESAKVTLRAKLTTVSDAYVVQEIQKCRVRVPKGVRRKLVRGKVPERKGKYHSEERV
ncbi:hypothetical protein E2C01_071487 [Portunus trituberculatus]|uniref:Uncharacterized protein n=1 Tax=Portunus trituberculatus TaxID=210409 RepID=A0A5B7I6C7_PORTR|nr:hypothetical protein [Portunus trituberculatus]